MANAKGSRRINHPVPEVFGEGTNSVHWFSDESNLITISPREKLIRRGGIIDVFHNIPIIGKPGDCEAEVTECIENQRVRVEGAAEGLGHIALQVDLEETKEGLTMAFFELNTDFNQMPRLKRTVVDAGARTVLNPFIDGYAESVSIRISQAIVASQGATSRQAA